MELTQYLSGVLSHFKDSRVVKNVTELVQHIIEHKSIRLWSIAADKAEFDRSKRLLDGSLKSVLDAEKTAAALREHSIAALGAEAHLILLHDPCDLRKEYAAKLEKLGKVRDLDGNIINGYSTFNSVGVDVTGKQLYPIDITVYSNRDEHYVTVEELDKFEKGKLQKSPDAAERERGQQIAQLVAEKDYLNLPQLTKAQLREISRAFKAHNPTITLRHVLDRQFDGQGYFAFIAQELHDEFVIRAQISRNSNEVTVDPQTNKTVAIKLKDVALPHNHSTVLAKLKVKKKLYQDVKRLLEWGTLTLAGQTYTVVRITLQDRNGQALYKHPMLLLSNIKVANAAQAREIYATYLLRAKIEAVFKFLKEVLGWEEFQVRDYTAIQNLIALAYFIGGYFYEIGSDLTQNPTIALLAQLGGGKGQVTRHYFLEGLRRLLVHTRVARFIEEQAVAEETFAAMLAFVT